MEQGTVKQETLEPALSSAVAIKHPFLATLRVPSSLWVQKGPCFAVSKTPQLSVPSC